MNSEERRTASVGCLPSIEHLDYQWSTKSPVASTTKWVLKKKASLPTISSTAWNDELDQLIASQLSNSSQFFKAKLYERLGSWELLSAVASLMYKKLFDNSETRPFFIGKDQAKIMRHMAGFLSCALNGCLTISPKELWETHRHMMWRPVKSVPAGNGHEAAATAASPTDSIFCSATAAVAAAAAAEGLVNASCPAHLPGDTACDAATATCGDLFAPAVCPLASTRGSSMSSIQDSVSSSGPSSSSGTPTSAVPHAASPVTPPLGPRHVAVMTQLLKDALVEVDARQELIDDMVKVLSSMSYLFERGDEFVDIKGEEAKWQHELSIQAMHEEALRSQAMPSRVRSLDSSRHGRDLAKQVSLASPFAGSFDQGPAVPFAAEEQEEEEHERVLESMRELFASW